MSQALKNYECNNYTNLKKNRKKIIGHRAPDTDKKKKKVSGFGGETEPNIYEKFSRYVGNEFFLNSIFSQ